MTNILETPRLLILTIGVYLLMSILPSSINTQQRDPITKEGLLKSLGNKVLLSRELIEQIEQRGVSFKLTSTDEQDIRDAGSYLGKTGLDRLIAAVRDNYRPNASQQPTPIPTSPPLRGLLIPANDPSPPSPCGDAPPPYKTVYFGKSAAMVNPTQNSFALFRIDNEDVLSVENTTAGILINATIRDEKGKVVATIKKNVFRAESAEDYEATNPDQHSLLILDNKDQTVLYIRYLNPHAIKVLGIFRHPTKAPIVVEEGGMIIGTRKIGAVCIGEVGRWAGQVGFNYP